MAHSTVSHALHSSGRKAATPALSARIGSVFALWRQRRALASLPEHLREDVGLTEAEVEREARRHMWDVPNHWRF